MAHWKDLIISDAKEVITNARRIKEILFAKASGSWEATGISLRLDFIKQVSVLLKFSKTWINLMNPQRTIFTWEKFQAVFFAKKIVSDQFTRFEKTFKNTLNVNDDYLICSKFVAWSENPFITFKYSNCASIWTRPFQFLTSTRKRMKR